MIKVTEKQWFEIGDGFKGMTPLTLRRQVAEECLVKDSNSRRMLTEGVNFIIDDEEGRKYADIHNA